MRLIKRIARVIGPRILVIAVVCAMTLAAGIAADAPGVPVYKVDAAWPKQLPNNWIVGQIGGMAVDKDDHIWVLHRPRSLSVDEVAAAQTPPTAECCIAAPSVWNLILTATY